MSATCKSCGAAITWAITERGHKMPVDAVPPLLGGNVELVPASTPGGDPTAKVHGAREQRPGWFVSHFSTCVDADQHRRTKLRPDGKRR